MPNLQSSSLLPFSPNFRDSPYKEWLQLATTEKEYFDLIRSFYGLPKSWIEWAEKQVTANVKRGIRLQNPLAYRLSILWSGIILLQENKFICDTVENAFRQCFTDHVSASQITYHDLLPTIPDGGKLKSKYEFDVGSSIDPTSVVPSDFIFSFTFYQLAETMARNWEYRTKPNARRLCVATLFWNEPRCRDVNLFRKCMKTIREYRNAVAHSKQLFIPSETQKLYEIALIWLEPLGVRLDQKVRAYRSRRPNFLQDLRAIRSD
jgi:hypothetical protein